MLFISLQNTCIDFMKQPAMTVCSQAKKADQMHFVIAVDFSILRQTNKCTE